MPPKHRRPTAVSVWLGLTFASLPTRTITQCPDLSSDHCSDFSSIIAAVEPLRIIEDVILSPIQLRNDS